ncbi:MAG: CDP-alcohol phosphatidyltransferase family protein, partial [Candidatus Cloacimonetes bacterium]|nr:CDP-alcohol phosphatidyltransferase family protein [Candidatus Cloacimonadota bacterium]
MTLANQLTAARIFLSPIFVLAFMQEGFWARVAALAIVVMSELTDGFDGHIARSRGEVTDFGKLLDPLADSISRITVFIAFMSVGLIPWWMVLIFVYRDSAVSTLRTVCASKG